MSQLKTVAVENAPKAIGPYAQGIVAGGFLFTAGQVPLDPATMKLVSGTIAEETNRVFDNLDAILAGAGCRLADVVKMTTVMGRELAELRARHGDSWQPTPVAAVSPTVGCTGTCCSRSASASSISGSSAWPAARRRAAAPGRSPAPCRA